MLSTSQINKDVLKPVSFAVFFPKEWKKWRIVKDSHFLEHRNKNMVCNTCLGSLPNEIRINKIGLAASKAALACVKPPPGTLSSQVG